MSACRAFLLFACVSAASASSAYAAEDDHGRQDFEVGRKLYFEGEYAAALPHLQRAYQLSGKRASTIRAVAQCELALGMEREALQHLHEYLATTPRPPDAADIQAQIQDLEAHALEPERTLRPVEREHEEEDFVWDATRRPPPPREIAPFVEPATPMIQQPSLVERPVFWIVVLGVLAASTATAFLLTSGDDPLYGGSQDRVLRR